MGAPRSGTTWLHKMIGEHANVCSTGGVELTFFSNYLPPLIDRWNFEKNNMDKKRWVKGLPYLWSYDEFIRFLNEFFLKVYGKLLQEKNESTHIVNKNPAYTNHIDLINHFLPQAKFIHIIRDGRDVAVSLLSAKKRIGFGPDNIFDAARFWRKSVNRGRKASNLGKEKYFEVKYENLIMDTFGGLKEIFDFCGLSVDDKFLHNLVDQYNYKMNPVGSPNPDAKLIRNRKGVVWREKMSPMQKCIFNMVGGNLLSELNYSTCKGNWWYDNDFQKIWLMTAYPVYSFFYYGSKLIKIIRQKIKDEQQ